MNRVVFDTCFFVAGYYSPDQLHTRKLNEKVKTTKERFVSSVVLHEVYQLTLRKNR